MERSIRTEAQEVDNKSSHKKGSGNFLSLLVVPKKQEKTIPFKGSQTNTYATQALDWQCCIVILVSHQPLSYVVAKYAAVV